MPSIFNSIGGSAVTGAPDGSGTAPGGGGGSGNTLGLNLGGINLNYDLGPSVSTVAQQSNAFINNSFNADTAFLGGAITGSQNFLNGIISPVLSMAQDQQDFNTQQLPSMFNQLNNQNFQLGSYAIGTEGNVANAEVAQANATARANSGGGSLCYITTAVCDTLGLSDDCHTLKMLRWFRDTYMQSTQLRREFVAEYYRDAPKLIVRMRMRKDANAYIARLYERFILPCCIAIDQGALDRCFKLYRRMLYTVREENPPCGPQFLEKQT